MVTLLSQIEIGARNERPSAFLLFALDRAALR